MAEGGKLERKVVSGVAWSFSEKFLTMVVQMVVSIIVARRLMPEDFGVMAILTFFTSVALTIVDSGFSQTLIRRKEPTDEEYRSVLTFNILTSVILYVILVLSARWLADFYNHAIIAEVAPVLFLLLPINAMCVVQTVMFTREFRFALLSKIVFSASIVSGVVAVVMAVCGCGIWSLVAQRLLAMGIKAIAFWWIRRWRSEARGSIKALRTLAPFSLRLLATDLIASIYNNIAQLFIGKMHSTGILGYYSQAQKLKDLPVISTVQAVQGVTYPALSTLTDDNAKFAEAYRRIIMLCSFAVMPVMLGLVAVAPELFALLLGDKWMPTVPYFEILALSGVVYPLSMVAYNVLKVRSDGRVILHLEVAKRAIMTLILIYTIPQSVEAIAWGMSLMALLDYLINTVAATRFTSLSLWRTVGAMLPSLLLAGVMFGALYLLDEHFATLTLGWRLLAKVATGAAIYLLLAALLRLKALSEAVTLLRGYGRSTQSDISVKNG